MSVLTPLRTPVRKWLAKHGYVLWKIDYLRFGVLPFADVARLGRTQGFEITVVFDVGANAGQTCRELLEAFPQARIAAFEPHPDTMSRFRSAVTDPRVTAHQLALADTTGDVTLYEYGNRAGGSMLNSLVPDARFPRQFGYEPRIRAVPSTTLDRFCETTNVDRIDLLKIDTEGSELAVLKGAERMLEQRRVRFIYVEFNDLEPAPDVTGGALVPIASFLARFGFRYVATYTDSVLHREDLFVCANALFARWTAASDRS